MRKSITNQAIVRISGLAVGGVFALGGNVRAEKTALDGPVTIELSGDIRDATLQERLAALEISALDAVVAKHGVAADNLSIAQSSVASFPTLGMEVYSYKVLDEVNGTVHAMLVDETGAELDNDALTLAEADAYDATFGKMHPTLAEVVPTLAGDESVPVIIWLNESPGEPAIRPEPGTKLSKLQAEAFASTADLARKQAVSTIVTPFAQELADAGFEVLTDEYSPTIYAEMDPTSLAQLAQRSEVSRIYLDEQNEANLSTARAVVKANVVNGKGFTGTGIRVGVLEVGGRIAAANPFLAGATQDLAFSCLHAHATAVAGMVRSTDGVHRGVAPGVNLWVGGSCGGWSGELQSRATAAADWGARVINNSWGSTSGSRVPDANSRFFDNMVINRFRTIIFAAGNRGGPCNGDGVVTNPAIAYNVIAVGNFNDNGTVATGDDTMSACSSFVDPISAHSDREKPEVSGPGTSITSTTNAWPWIANTGSGTSYSAPMVSGIAAMLIQRNGVLSVWPEAIKAILMATATQNIEGGARLSEKDGAGGVQADRADDVARGVNGSFGTRLYNCAQPANLDVASIYLVGGVRTRIVLTFDTDPAYGSYTTQPCADLDMHILKGGAFVTASASYDNTYEIVDFVPPSSGFYTIRVHKFRCDMSPRYMAYAYHQLF